MVGGRVHSPLRRRGGIRRQLEIPRGPPGQVGEVGGSSPSQRSVGPTEDEAAGSTEPWLPTRGEEGIGAGAPFHGDPLPPPRRRGGGRANCIERGGGEYKGRRHFYEPLAFISPILIRRDNVLITSISIIHNHPLSRKQLMFQLKKEWRDWV